MKKTINNKEYFQMENIWYSNDKNGKQRKVSSDKLLVELNEEEQILPPLPSKGLGDTIKSITSALGISQCEPCVKRQNKLNKLFPYLKANEMDRLDEEDQALMERVLANPNVSNDDANGIFALYNKRYAPRPPVKRCMCVGLFRTMIERLQLLMEYPEGE